MGKKKTKKPGHYKKKKQLLKKPLKSKFAKAKSLYDSENRKNLKKKNQVQGKKYRTTVKTKAADQSVFTDDLFMATLKEHEGEQRANSILESVSQSVGGDFQDSFANKHYQKEEDADIERLDWEEDEGFQVLTNYKLGEEGQIIQTEKVVENVIEKEKESKMIESVEQNKRKRKRDTRDMITISAKEKRIIPKAFEKAWAPLGVPMSLIHQLYKLNYEKPTKIQEAVIPAAVKRQKNVIAIAKTGSGKTLAFGLPLLTKICSSNASVRECRGLIICPTRELAMQVKQHLQDAIQTLGIQADVLIGGMSRQKQERVLTKDKPQILITTPGRLHEYLCEALKPLPHLANLHETLEFVILDEVDRMVADGHFLELDQILDKIAVGQDRIQKIVTSATLKKAKEQIQKLTKRMHFTSKNSVNIELDGDILSDTILESQVRCESSKRDLYLYYMLYMFKGKSLVFANSLSAVKHIYDTMIKLNIKCFQLHRNMKMRQRLNSIDRFKSNKFPNCALIATDLAARGIDIPSVNQVIHYTLPQTPELYIHRCGRSGRAGESGFSVAFITEQDHHQYKRIVLREEKVTPLRMLPIKQFYIRDMTPRVRIASEIVGINRKYAKKRYETSWMQKMANEAGIAIDDDMLSDDEMNDQETIKREKLEHDFEKTMRKRVGSSKLTSKKYVMNEAKGGSLGLSTSNQLDMKTEFLRVYAEEIKQDLAIKDAEEDNVEDDDDE